VERGGAVLGLAVVYLGALGTLGVAIALSKMRREEELPPEEEEELPPEEEEEVVEVIDAEFREGWVYWAALTNWKEVHTRWPNEWPADTDITFAWDIKNIGDVGAYFQVYLFTPGDWLYLGPNDRIVVYETFHTPAIPVTPGYQYYRINILARKVTGERIGAVWTSEEIQVSYV